MAKEDPPFGPRLRIARERAGLNKNQLARELATSWQHVDNWERGRVQPSLGSVRRLAELLSVSSDFLLGLVSDPAPLAMSPLDEYLQSGAPDDLSATEEQWLRNAPVAPEGVTPESYAQLLASLRGVSNAQPSNAQPSHAQPSQAQPTRRPPKSGVRSRVNRAEVDPAAAEEAPKAKRKAKRNRSSLAHRVDKAAIAAAIAPEDVGESD